MRIKELSNKLKERIFKQVRRDDKEEVAKVSQTWFLLTIGTVTTINVHDVLWMEHLVQFINRTYRKRLSWYALFGSMINLSELDSCYFDDDYFRKTADLINGESVQIFFGLQTVLKTEKCPHLFSSLTKLCWGEPQNYNGSTPSLFKLIPSLTEVVLHLKSMGRDWIQAVPAKIKSLDLRIEEFIDDMATVFCISAICENPKALKILKLSEIKLLPPKLYNDFNALPNLRKFALTTKASREEVTRFTLNVLKACKKLVAIHIKNVEIHEAWQKAVPPNIKWLKLSDPTVSNSALADFSMQYIFEDVTELKCLEISGYTFEGCNPNAFSSLNGLKYLSLTMTHLTQPPDAFYGISKTLASSSGLTTLTISVAPILTSWRKVIPKTVTRLELKEVLLEEVMLDVFTPEYILEDPSTLTYLVMFVLHPLGSQVNAFFHKMHKLQTLRLGCSPMTSKMMESLFKNCKYLTYLSLIGLEDAELSKITRSLRSPATKELELAIDTVSPYPIFLHFPGVTRLNIAIVGQDEQVRSFTFVWASLEILEVQFKHISEETLDYLMTKTEASGFKYVYVTSDAEGCHVFHLANCLSWISGELYIDYFKGDSMRYLGGFQTSLAEKEAETEAEGDKKSGYMSSIKTYVSKFWTKP